MTQPVLRSSDSPDRQRIRAAGAACFRRDRYAAATLPDIAAEAQLSLPDLEQHYPDKAAIARDIFHERIETLLCTMESLPSGPLAERFRQALQDAIAALETDREALCGVFAETLLKDAQIDLMAGPLAQRLVAAFHQLARESDDALPGPKSQDIGVVLYALFMLIIVVWLYDRTPAQSATKKLLAYVCDMFKLLRPLFILPLVPQGIARLAAIVRYRMEATSIGAAAKDDARDRQHQNLDVHRD